MLIRVTREHHCPICDHPDWCSYSDDGELVHCMRVPSEHEAKTGWIHLLTDPKPIHDPPEPLPKLTVEQCEQLAKDCYTHRNAVESRSKLSSQLGVSAESLDRLRVGWGLDWNGREWTSWPCRDSSGRIVGLTRRYDDGSKKTYPGTRAGLFYERDWLRHPGAVLIVEGGSDVAACIDAGLSAIGRPSNIGGGSWLTDLVASASPRPIVVVAERDEKPERRGTVEHCPENCPGCANCWPGLYGAKETAKKLGMPDNWVLPRVGKDFREAFSNGESVEFFKMMWRGA